MKIDELVSKAESFAMNFVAKLGDKTMQPARKQAYFLDNQDDLQKYMGALQKVINSLDKDDESEDGEDCAVLLSRAESVIDMLKAAIMVYQKELTVSDNITEEETTAVFTTETLSDAMTNNETTKEIAVNMNNIAAEQKQAATQVNYNYALVCDGQMNMIAATTKGELNDAINAIAENGNYQNIALYKMQFTPVPLKQKTVLSI